MMPAASNKTEPKTSPEATDPTSRSFLTILDKKVRNIEKRKSRLDVIRAKKAAGDALEKEQQETLNNYDGVVASLDFARDLQKTFTSNAQDLEKQQKKQLKREKQEKAANDLKRTVDLLQIQATLDALGSENVREHYKTGKHGAVVLTEDNLNSLDEIFKLITPPPPGEANYMEQLNAAGEHINNLLEGKERAVAGSTYKELMDLLHLIIGCGYFERAREAEEEETIGESEENGGGVDNTGNASKEENSNGDSYKTCNHVFGPNTGIAGKEEENSGDWSDHAGNPDENENCDDLEDFDIKNVEEEYEGHIKELNWSEQVDEAEKKTLETLPVEVVGCAPGEGDSEDGGSRQADHNGLTMMVGSELDGEHWPTNTDVVVLAKAPSGNAAVSMVAPHSCVLEHEDLRAAEYDCNRVTISEQQVNIPDKDWGAETGDWHQVTKQQASVPDASDWHQVTVSEQHASVPDESVEDWGAADDDLVLVDNSQQRASVPDESVEDWGAAEDDLVLVDNSQQQASVPVKPAFELEDRGAEVDKQEKALECEQMRITSKKNKAGKTSDLRKLNENINWAEVVKVGICTEQNNARVISCPNIGLVGKSHPSVKFDGSGRPLASCPNIGLSGKSHARVKFDGSGWTLASYRDHGSKGRDGCYERPWVSARTGRPYWTSQGKQKGRNSSFGSQGYGKKSGQDSFGN